MKSLAEELIKIFVHSYIYVSSLKKRVGMVKRKRAINKVMTKRRKRKRELEELNS